MKTLITLLSLWLAPLCVAQTTLLPVYDASVGKAALAQVPPGAKLALIVNPNSGPGDTRDAGMFEVVKRANAKRVQVFFYVDLVANPGDGLIPSGAKKRPKTTAELRAERVAYSKNFKGLQWDGWFADDVNGTTNTGVAELKTWPLVKIYNPGCRVNDGPADGFIVISETAGAWPRELTPWERGHLAQCVVMGLGIADLSAFKTSAAGVGYWYASPLADRWKKGQSAYTQLTPYFNSLLKWHR